MDFSVLEEEERVIKLTVIAIGEIPERAINYLQEKKQINTNLYVLKGKKKFLRSSMQPSCDYLELLRIDVSRPSQNITDGLENIRSPFALVVGQQAENLKVALHIEPFSEYAIKNSSTSIIPDNLSCVLAVLAIKKRCRHKKAVFRLM